MTTLITWAVRTDNAAPSGASFEWSASQSNDVRTAVNDNATLQDAIQTALGIANGAVNFGTFTNTVTPDNMDLKSILETTGSLLEAITTGSHTHVLAHITDAGTAASKFVGVANGQIPVMDAVGYPAANGSQITNINWGLQRGRILIISQTNLNGATFTSLTLNTTPVINTLAGLSVAASSFNLAAGTYLLTINLSSLVAAAEITLEGRINDGTTDFDFWTTGYAPALGGADTYAISHTRLLLLGASATITIQFRQAGAVGTVTTDAARSHIDILKFE